MIVALRGYFRLLRDRTRDTRARQGAWSIFEYLAYPAMMFLATPAFISALGAEQYGQWMLLLTFNGFGGVAGLGMGSATIKEVSEFRGRGDMAGAAESVRNSVGITLASSLALAALIVAIGITFGPNLLSRVGKPEVIVAISIAAALSIVLEQIDVVFVGAIKGFERFDLSAPVEAISKAAIVLAALAVARETGSLYWVILTSLMLTVVRTGLKAIVAGRLTGAGVLLPHWHAASIRRIFAFGKWTWLLAIASALFGTVDRLLIGGSLGAESLARYSVCLQLAQQVQAVPAAAAQIFFPMVSRMVAEGRDVRRVAAKAMLLLCVSSILIGAPIIAFRSDILRLWVGPDIAMGGAPVLATLVLAFMVLAINNVPHYVLLGLGRSRTVALVNIIAGLISAVCCYAALQAYGLAGAAFGRLAFAVVICGLAIEMFRQIKDR